MQKIHQKPDPKSKNVKRTASPPEAVERRPEVAFTPEEIEAAIGYLAEHPETIPYELKVRLLQDLVQKNANTALVELGSQLRQLAEKSPTEEFLCQLFVESWALAHRKRIIDDSKISESIRQERSQRKKGYKKNILKRFIDEFVLNGVDETALIREYEDLAARVEALKLEQARLLAENESAKERNEIAIRKASIEAQSVTTEATRGAQEIIELATHAAQVKEEKATNRSREIIERAEAEKEREFTRLEAKEKALEQYVAKLKEDVARLEGIRNALLQDPEVAKGWEEKGELRFLSLETRILGFADRLSVFHSLGQDGDRLSREDTNNPNKLEFLDILKHFYHEVFEVLEAVEKDIGVESRKLIARRLLGRIQALNTAVCIYRGGPSRYYDIVVTGHVFERYVAACILDNIGASEVKEVFYRVLSPFLDQENYAKIHPQDLDKAIHRAIEELEKSFSSRIESRPI